MGQILAERTWEAAGELQASAVPEARLTGPAATLHLSIPPAP